MIATGSCGICIFSRGSNTAECLACYGATGLTATSLFNALEQCGLISDNEDDGGGGGDESSNTGGTGKEAGTGGCTTENFTRTQTQTTCTTGADGISHCQSNEVTTNYTVSVC